MVNDLELLLVGIVFLAIGAFYTITTDLAIKLQVWSNKVIAGAKFIPSNKTTLVFKIFGAFFLVLGAVMAYYGY